MLTYHIPEKAQTHFTTGMELENTSEAICPAFIGISGPECMPQFRIRKYGCHWQLASNGYTAVQTYLTWGKQRKGNSQDVVKTHTTKGNAVNQRTGYLLHGGERWDKPKLPKKCWVLFIQVNTRCFNICQQEWLVLELTTLKFFWS